MPNDPSGACDDDGVVTPRHDMATARRAFLDHQARFVVATFALAEGDVVLVSGETAAAERFAALD